MTSQSDRSDPLLALAFAPVHKLALGVASGIVIGFLLMFVTLIAVAINDGDGARAEYLGLLRIYFTGYSVSPLGALVGFFWGFIVGFVTGFFCAFLRNLTVAAAIFALRTKAELTETMDFMDHI
jgi:hypothetical protein